MQLQGTYKYRYTFPQWPWSTLKDPRYLQTEHGNALLIDGWWQFLRKPNYTADWTQAFLWGAIAVPGPSSLTTTRSFPRRLDAPMWTRFREVRKEVRKGLGEVLHHCQVRFHSFVY